MISSVTTPSVPNTLQTVCSIERSDWPPSPTYTCPILVPPSLFSNLRIKRSMADVNTDRIETELLKNEMIAQVEAYKTPSGIIKLEVMQKMPILRIMGVRGSYYVDNLGTTMPISRRYAAHVPIVSGYVEKELAVTDLYKFALFLQENEFWNDQIEQIYVYPDNDIELIPRVGNHRIMLGTLNEFEEKLANLKLF